MFASSRLEIDCFHDFEEQVEQMLAAQATLRARQQDTKTSFVMLFPRRKQLEEMKMIADENRQVEYSKEKGSAGH